MIRPFGTKWDRSQLPLGAFPNLWLDPGGKPCVTMPHVGGWTTCKSYAPADGLALRRARVFNAGGDGDVAPQGPTRPYRGAMPKLTSVTNFRR